MKAPIHRWRRFSQIFVLNLRHLQNLQMNQTHIENCWRRSAVHRRMVDRCWRPAAIQRIATVHGLTHTFFLA